MIKILHLLLKVYVNNIMHRYIAYRFVFNQTTRNKTKHKPLATISNYKKNRNNNKPTEKQPHLPHTRTPHEEPTTDEMYLMRSYSDCKTVKHLMTEFRSNEEEREKFNLPTNLYEIIGPDY